MLEPSLQQGKVAVYPERQTATLFYWFHFCNTVLLISLLHGFFLISMRQSELSKHRSLTLLFFSFLQTNQRRQQVETKSGCYDIYRHQQMIVLQPILSDSYTYTHTQPGPADLFFKSPGPAELFFRYAVTICLKLSSVPFNWGFSWENLIKSSSCVRLEFEGPRQKHCWQMFICLEGPHIGDSRRVIQMELGESDMSPLCMFYVNKKMTDSEPIFWDICLCHMHFFF